MTCGARDLETILRAHAPLMEVLETARGLALPDWLVFSGAVYQPVLNHLTGRPLAHGLKDYDLAYYEGDVSYEAEDEVIRRVRARFDGPLADLVEVRNQARVHLWFEAHFGEAYDPLADTAEALTRFVSPLFAVGVRLEPDGTMTVRAPFGLDDLFDLRLRRNPTRRSPNYGRIAAAAKARWPELDVEP